jgi:HEAT repeat protein
LRADSRPIVRQNAIVALSASLAADNIEDFVTALNDADVAVVSEAGFTIAGRLTNQTLGAQAREQGVVALQQHLNSLRMAFGSKRERVRFNAVYALEAIKDRDLKLSAVLSDEGSLIRGEGLRLAEARASTKEGLTRDDLDALVDFVGRTTDAELHDGVMDLVVRFAPQRAAVPLLRAIASGSATFHDLQHAVDLRLEGTPSAVIEHLSKHPDKWTKEDLDALVAFRAVCAGPMLAEFWKGTVDNSALSFLRAALRELSGHSDWSDEKLIGWARSQDHGQPPCRSTTP